MAVARGVTLYRKKKHRECRVRVIICPEREIVQVGVVVISAGNDNRNHQLRFCKTEINRKSDEIEGTRGYQKVLSLRHFPHSDSTMLHT